MSIREEAENERQKLKNMSWKDRTWYVWEYYKFHLLAVILVIGVLSTIGTMISVSYTHLTLPTTPYV